MHKTLYDVLDAIEKIRKESSGQYKDYETEEEVRGKFVTKKKDK